MTGNALADVEYALDAAGGGPLAPAAAGPAAGVGALVRVRIALVGIGAAVLGVLSHVLHHVGPLAGAALLAVASGRLLFGLLGFAAMAPMLRRMRGRTGSWRAPGGLLPAMAAVFAHRRSSWARRSQAVLTAIAPRTVRRSPCLTRAVMTASTDNTCNIP